MGTNQGYPKVLRNQDLGRRESPRRIIMEEFYLRWTELVFVGNEQKRQDFEVRGSREAIDKLARCLRELDACLALSVATSNGKVVTLD